MCYVLIAVTITWKDIWKEKSLFWLIILETKFEVSFKANVRQNILESRTQRELAVW